MAASIGAQKKKEARFTLMEIPNMIFSCTSLHVIEHEKICSMQFKVCTFVVLYVTIT